MRFDKGNCRKKRVFSQPDVSQLHEVWEKESLNFRLKTELSDTKPASELA